MLELESSRKEKTTCFCVHYKSLRSSVDWFRFRSSMIIRYDYLYSLIFNLNKAIILYRSSLCLYYSIKLTVRFCPDPSSFLIHFGMCEKQDVENLLKQFEILESNPRELSVEMQTSKLI